MGYFVKTRQLSSAASSVMLPSGPTSARPSSPQDGQLRFNTDTNRFEMYYSGTWSNIAKTGNVPIAKDSFTGDGLTAAFTLSSAPASEEGVQVFVGNVHQNPGAAYTITSSTITFSVAPPLSQTVEVYQGFDSTDAH